jgi:hypothetical protein
MEGLLFHWDFSPGLAVEDQVRRRFGSSVHFSPSLGHREFFLVVSFEGFRSIEKKIPMMTNKNKPRSDLRDAKQ